MEQNHHLGERIVGISEILLFQMIRLAQEKGQTAVGKEHGGEIIARKVHKRL